MLLSSIPTHGLYRGDGAGPAGTAAAGPMLEAKLMNLIKGRLQKFWLSNNFSVKFMRSCASAASPDQSWYASDATALRTIVSGLGMRPVPVLQIAYLSSTRLLYSGSCPSLAINSHGHERDERWEWTTLRSLLVLHINFLKETARSQEWLVLYIYTSDQRNQCPVGCSLRKIVYTCSFSFFEIVN